MSRQPESRLSGKIMLALRQRGAWCFKVHGSAAQMSGVPDILGVWHGVFFGIETKMPGKEHSRSARQRLVMGDIQRAGGIAFVSSSVAHSLETLDREFYEANEHLPRFNRLEE